MNEFPPPLPTIVCERGGASSLFSLDDSVVDYEREIVIVTAMPGRWASGTVPLLAPGIGLGAIDDQGVVFFVGNPCGTPRCSGTPVIEPPCERRPVGIRVPRRPRIVIVTPYECDPRLSEADARVSSRR